MGTCECATKQPILCQCAKKLRVTAFPACDCLNESTAVPKCTCKPKPRPKKVIPPPCCCRCLVKRDGTLPNVTKKKLYKAYGKLLASYSDSLLYKYLAPGIFDFYKKKKTSMGANLLDVISSGCQYPRKSSIGVYAPDEESYTLFNMLFDPIIADLHNFGPRDEHQCHVWGNFRKFHSHDADGKFVHSTRIRLCRNLKGYPFFPKMTRKLYQEIMDKVEPVLRNYDKDAYWMPLEKMTDARRKALVYDHYMFPRNNKFLQAAGADHFWPTGRALWINRACDLMVWVNKDDHLRIISMEVGRDMQSVYKRLMAITNYLEDNLEFAHTRRLGYITTCPSNLGTTLRASFLIRLPKLKVEHVVELCKESNLEVRGTYGLGYPVTRGLYNIGNTSRLGLTEFEAVMELQDGIAKVIWEQEKLDIQEYDENERKRLSGKDLPMDDDEDEDEDEDESPVLGRASTEDGGEPTAEVDDTAETPEA